jgi:capsular exopolysaccharide synthesis family protein
MKTSFDARPHLDYWRIVRIRLGWVILIVLLALATAGVITLLNPKEYASFVTIEANPDTREYIFEGPTSQKINDPKFAETQFQLITSQGMLYPVIQKLDLQKKWSANGGRLTLEALYNRLRAMVQLHEVRDPKLIVISVSGAESREATLLANTIAQEYVDRRISEQQTLIAKELDQLRADVEQKENAVSQAFAKASRLRTAAGFVDPNPDSTDESKRTEKASATTSAQCLDAKNRYDEERRLLETTQAKLDTGTTESAKLEKRAMIQDPAKAVQVSRSPTIFPNLFLGAVTGLLLGVGVAFFAEYLDRSVKTLRQVERLLRVPVLAAIPKNSQRISHANPKDLSAEAYRILKTRVDSARQKMGASVLTVVSSGPGEGKSTTVCHLAAVFAASGQQTLVIDANLHHPSQHDLFGINNQIGLSDYLTGKMALDQIIRDGLLPNLFIVTSGSSHASVISLLSLQKFAELVEIVKDWFDVVIFDCPPILEERDAAVISALADGSIIVAQHRRFPRSMMIRARAALQSVGTPILGVVLSSAYMKYGRVKTFPKVTVSKSPEREFQMSDFEAARQ